MQRSRPSGGTSGSNSHSTTNKSMKNVSKPRKNDSSPSTTSRMSSGAITRARSHSASSSKTSATGTTSSGGSSSSASSSSSSSSGSGSDSSSSETEASRASSQSRGSRSSRKSQGSDNKGTVIRSGTVTATGSNKSSSSGVPLKSHKHSGNTSGSSPQVPTQSHKKSKTPSSSSVISSGAVSNSTVSNALANKGRNRPPLSGSVTNVKAPIARVAPTRPFNRKSFAATSSESESSSAVASPIKRVGSKPPSNPVTVKKPPSATSTSSSLKKVARSKPSSSSASAASSSQKNKTSGLTNGKISSAPVRTQKKLIKSIFSPDNSSADSDEEKRVRSRGGHEASSSGVRSPVSITGSIIAAKKSSIASRFKKRLSPAPNTNHAATSSSLSATSSGSSSSSSSDSSSESDKKLPEGASSGSGKREPSPKSPSNSGRKRPVTRRQIRSSAKSKTIPTTTIFSQSVASPSPLQISAWGDSDFSDEPRSLVRVPAKSSHKSRPRPTDDEEDIMERERRCRFPGCDSTGHLSGRFPTHSLLSTCPKYAGFSVEECKENAAERQKRETERKRYYTFNIPHQKKPSKLSQDAKTWIVKMRDMKEKPTKDGLSSEYDASLWNDSLALAAARIEIEQGEAISYRSVAVGRFEMSCWCESPYSEPLSHSRRLFICEFCLKPVQSGTVLRRHCAKCVWRHPPGDEIYRKDRLSVWEVDGKTQKTYCQNLCLLAKCFLDHKTLYLDVDPFLFYVMTIADSQGCHLVGYFSKEKNSFLNYNVSCILTLPPYQRQGFGRLLIDFSYLLTRVEGKVGSPEKPLSDLGLISYRSYWKDAVLRRMCACATREMNVKDLSIELGVTSADLISTLQFLGMLKYWKGKHLVLKKTDVLEEYLERVRRRGETRQIEPSCLRWRPFQPPAETSS